MGDLSIDNLSISGGRHRTIRQHVRRATNDTTVGASHTFALLRRQFWHACATVRSRFPIRSSLTRGGPGLTSPLGRIEVYIVRLCDPVSCTLTRLDSSTTRGLKPICQSIKCCESRYEPPHEMDAGADQAWGRCLSKEEVSRKDSGGKRTQAQAASGQAFVLLLVWQSSKVAYAKPEPW
jgi:hypothetical protein